MKNNNPIFIKFLQERQSYRHKTTNIKIKETHVSWIILTGKYAYKIKKSVKIDTILDYSQLKFRKKLCMKEVKLNNFLCWPIYKKTVKIVQNANSFKIVSMKSNVPPIEYAIQMIEIPQKYLMENLLQANKISYHMIDKLTDVLVTYHKSCLTNKKIAKCGNVSFIKNKLIHLLETLKKLTFLNPIIKKRLLQFLKNNKKIFTLRVKDKKVRDVHGDLHLQNIFLFRKKIYPYDRIEFNDQLRFADVSDDVAMLAMDLDFHNRKDLREFFVSRYVEKSQDYLMLKILPFMMCYKACVKAKVFAFMIKNETNSKMKQNTLLNLNKSLKLAQSYSEMLV